MLRLSPIRRPAFAFAIILGAALCVSLRAQTRPVSTLPPTAPTAARISPVSATAPQPDAATRAHRADVQYAAGLLSINASNSSLNQILREIARLTGMKITGGVRDERVFGHYGPAAPEVILATLIDANSTNMVLHETASSAPAELILTPRAGGPTPPNPNAPGFDDGNSDEDDRRQPPQRIVPQQRPGPQSYNPPPQNVTPDPSTPPSIPQPANNVNGSPFNSSPTASTFPTTNSVPTDSIPTPSTTPPSSGIVDSPNPPDPGTVNPVATNPPADSNTTTPDPNSPNGVKTPEQIFQQLQELQKQRQQQQQKSTTITPQ